VQQSVAVVALGQLLLLLHSLLHCLQEQPRFPA
jgi:hypothetical protein